VAFFTALIALSGGPFSNARFAYLLIPVVVAFRMRPRFTAAASGAVVLAYVIQAGAHPAASESGAHRFIATFALFLLWMGAACVLLSILLARRTQSVADLLAIRTGLLAQALSAEDRERRVLAEALHDGAVQNLLAARQDLDEVAPGDADAAQIGRIGHALDATLQDLRTALTELHPYVLDEVGLAAAIQRTAEHAAARADLELDLDLERSPRADGDALLYAVARELIGNVVRHAEARRLRVSLTATDGWRSLEVEDDGRGLDPGRLGERLSEGHIGLASQRARVEAARGSIEIVARPGQGTRVEVRVPEDLAIALTSSLPPKR
jgi:two-component system NarL family sensor kinase